MTLEHKGSVELSCTPYAFITRMAISILLIDIRSNHLHQIHYEPESLVRPGTSFLRALLLLSRILFLRTMCCLLFLVFFSLFLLFPCAVVSAGGSWAQCMGSPFPIVVSRRPLVLTLFGSPLLWIGRLKPRIIN